MPNVYSKVIRHTCYEIGHTWNPSCCISAFEIFISAFIYSCQMYGVVYAVTAALQYKQLDRHHLVKLFQNYLRSAIFLTINGFGYVGVFCVLRHLLGHINYPSISFLPGFLSALLAIQIERPSRRALLAFYVANVASECAFNVGVGYGYLRPVPHGSVLLFSAAMAVLGCCYHSRRHQPSPLLVSVIKFFVGGRECRAANDTSAPQGADQLLMEEGQLGDAASGEARGQDAPSGGASRCCPHTSSCLRYAVTPVRHAITSKSTTDGRASQRTLQSNLDSDAESTYLPSGTIYLACEPALTWYCVVQAGVSGGIKGILAGSAFSLLSMLGSLARNPSIVPLVVRGSAHMLLSPAQLLRFLLSPAQLVRRVRSSSHVRLALFIAWFSGVYRFVCCCCRRVRGRDATAHGALAGAVAGAGMVFYPAPGTALYTTWKTLETLCTLGVKDGVVPCIPGATELLYSVMTGYLFHMSAVHQHHMKPSYWNLLMNLTDQRMSQFNRHLLHPYGLDSGRNFAHFWPHYQPESVTAAFLSQYPLGMASLPA